MDKVILKLEDAVFVGDYIEQQIENFTADYEIQQTLKEFAKPIQKGLERKLDELQRARAENERLKEEVEHYRKEAYRLADGLNKTENLAFTYKQALHEIRDMIAKPYCCKPQDVIAKINEVIGAE